MPQAVHSRRSNVRIDPNVSVFTAYRKTLRGLQTGPTGLLRFDKAWKTER